MSKYKLSHLKENNNDKDSMNTLIGKFRIDKWENKNTQVLLLGFFLPVLMCLLICIRSGVYPFGDNCILHVDMYHQYTPFFTELMDKLRQTDSLFYSFQIGLGSDFISLIAYYLASPLNLLLIFCPKDYVIEFMTILIVVKIGLCGLSLTWYLKEHYRKISYAMPVFAGFYALSAYMAAYSWDIMWLDCLVLTPLILLGLEKLVKEKKTSLYCLALGLSIWSNFYISIMICIFVVIYYFILVWEENFTWKDRIATTGRFTLYSLLSGGMAAVLLIPEAIMLGYSGSSGIQFPEQAEYYFSLVNQLARHFFGVDVYLGRDHWPNLYCGVAIGILIVLYLLNTKISWKKKIKRLILIPIFWLSFANNYLDYIWHGLHFPDSLPGRQSFLYILLLLLLAYETYHYRKGNGLSHVIIASVVSIGTVGGIALLSDSGQLTTDSITITILLICIYALLLGLFFTTTIERKKNSILLMLGILALTELYVNFNQTGFSTTSRSAYTKNWKSVNALLSEIEERKETDEAFYRVEEMERLTKNDAALYDYSSSTIFSSLMNLNVANYYRKVGMEGGKNFYSYSGATPLTSAMLSVKYLISQSALEESPLRFLVTTDGINYIYQNKYNLPLGYMMDSEFEQEWDPQYGDPIHNLNQMANLLGAKENLLTPLDTSMISVTEDATIITVPEDMYIYGTYTDTSVTNITVTNQERVRKFSKTDHGYILDLGWCKANDQIVITNTNDKSYFSVIPYQLNIDSVDEAFSTLNQQTLAISTKTDRLIEGMIEVKKAGNLILSIPAEKGWSVLVDGKKVSADAFMDSFISIPLTVGTHQIQLNYVTPGFILGGSISSGCILVFLFLLLIKRKKRERRING